MNINNYCSLNQNQNFHLKHLINDNALNDAIYDAESTMIDNILRTKIIRNDPTKIFYLEDDMQTYTLLDNMSDLIYSLTWNNKTYYFQPIGMHEITCMMQ